MIGTYTFSIWHKSDKENIITFNFFGKTEEVSSTTKWQKYSKTIEVSSLNNPHIYITPSLNIQTYFYEGFLSEGSIDNSWSPAPEDIDSKFSSINIELSRITSTVYDPETGESKITQAANEIKQEIISKTTGKTLINSINAETGEALIQADHINLKGAVTAECITTDAVTADKIKANSITADKIQAGAITADKIAANAITADKIQTDAITADKIKAGEITGDKIKADTTITNKLNATNLHVSGESTFEGVITAKKGGSIGGWEIGNGRIYSQGSDGNYTKIQSTNGWTHAFVAGAPNKDNSTDAPFYVTHAGKMYAKDAQITGSITADSFTAYSYENDKQVGRLKLEGSGVLLKSLVEDIDYSLGVKDYYGNLSTRVYPHGISTYNGGSTGEFSYDGTSWGTEKPLFAKSLELDQYLSVGTRIFVPNGKGIRGMLNGKDFNSADALDNSAVVAYINTDNRTILGSAENPQPTEIRSPSDIFLKCNGGTSDTGSFSIRFHNTTDGNTYFRPCNSDVINLGSSGNPWKNIYATDLRAQGTLYLKCNGTSGDDSNRYGLGFSQVNFGTSDSPTYYGCLRPRADGYTVLGSSNYKFRNVYSTNGVSTTSDRNKKHDINPLSDKYIQLFDKLHPVSYVLNDGGERIHVGFISQDVENAMKEIGMSSMDFAGFCKDIVADDDGNYILDENGNEQTYYSLRYSEFIALNTEKIKRLESEVQSYSSTIKELKTENEQLKQQFNSQQQQINDLLKLIQV